MDGIINAIQPYEEQIFEIQKGNIGYSNLF